jgi:hypothetical protein
MFQLLAMLSVNRFFMNFCILELLRKQKPTIGQSGLPLSLKTKIISSVYYTLNTLQGKKSIQFNSSVWPFKYYALQSIIHSLKCLAIGWETVA